MEVATRPSALARVKSVWEFGGITASPLLITGDIRRRPWLTQARRSQEITPPSAALPGPPFAVDNAAVRGSPRPAVRGRSRRRSRLTQTRRSREITPPSTAHPGPPFAGDHAAVRGSPRPTVRGRSRRRPRLTQARHSREISPPSAAHPKPPARH